MAQQIINNGQFLDDPSAESVYQAFEKTKLNFAELYILAENQGYKKYRLDLSGININKSEMSYIADAINRGGRTPGGWGNPFTSDIGQKILFYTTSGLSSIQRGEGASPVTQVTYRFYRVHLAGQSFGGSAQSVTSAQLSPAGSYILNENNNPDSFIDLGDIGNSSVEAAFNLGKPEPYAGEPWIVSGLTIIKAIQGGVLKSWSFNGGDGIWGGSDVTNPNYRVARDFNFDLISDQPVLSPDLFISKTSKNYLQREITSTTPIVLDLSPEMTTFDISVNATSGIIDGFSSSAGVPATYDGCDVYIKNSTESPLVLKHNSPTPVPFKFKTENDVALLKDDIVHLKYSSEINKVELVGFLEGGNKPVPFGQLRILKIASNLNNNAIEVGDRVSASNLNDDIFLNMGVYIGGDPMDLSSYDPLSVDFYDPNNP